ncbi:MAG: hypothetical protein DRJ26_01110 [Candidatus Methanomethylicota archaeon]|uniref:Polymerase/histidinol phosphatase N-terminal domain-containing protein n=1 Tax=Thermoproteota archaeon TaxID=2056631 RepID=A0A497F7Z9_9CREN|nr:MAG: hypothetical protein DRJ26_01110 [Candidatus Verstraetearchaeota archaeon]
MLSENPTLIDMHVHSSCSDGLHHPIQLVKYAKRKGLSGIAIVDHVPKNWSGHVIIKRFRLYEEASLKADFLVLPGIELCLSEGHVLAIFPSFDLDLTFSSDVGDLPSLSEYVRSVGGIVIAAHVYRRSGLGLSAFKYANYLDALEYYPPPALDYLKDLNLPRTAGSDSHTALTLGFAATAFGEDVSSPMEALELIRRGLVKPICRRSFYLRKLLDFTRLLDLRLVLRLLTS